MRLDSTLLNAHPHRRFNPLRQEWVLVSPDRTARPWQGQLEKSAGTDTPAYDPSCYLCPGNTRAGGARNPQYASTFVFDNDYAALRPSTPLVEQSDADLLVARSEQGICRVVCFAPRHDLELSRMDLSAIRRVVDTWVDQWASLAAAPAIRYVQIFENRGAMMGASNPHPHGQIWATETIPNDPARERDAFTAYHARRGACLLCDYAAIEVREGERMVCENDAFFAVVPFWAVWPFETLVMSRRHIASLDALHDTERDALADMLRRLTTRYDNLFEAPFPYSMGFHPAPTNSGRHEWHLHVHFYPPLLRSATVRKFLVGFELLGSPQRDVTAEYAAERLRDASEVHYTTRRSSSVASASRRT